MIDDQLLIGIILIAAGVAIGLLAYALVLNRREGVETGVAESPVATEGAAETEAGEPGEALAEAEQAAAEAPADEVSEEVEPQGLPAAEQGVTTEVTEPSEGPLPAPPPEHVAPAADAPAPKGRRPIATLMRDNRTGKLTLVVGDREYVNPSELKGTNDWFGVEQASRDLTSWLSDAQRPEERTRRPPRTKSLVDEVNEILEQKLAETGLTNRGVSLVEDRDGSVRVYVGLQGYALEDVPDPEVREVIRQAVSEWEGRK
jgi:hypothetical protein